MKQTFADTSYWVATLDDKDQWFEQATNAASEIGESEIVTTESVLIEILNHFSDYRSDIKDYVANYVEEILKDEETLVLLHSHETFQKALQLYKSRLDKGYSLLHFDECDARVWHHRNSDQRRAFSSGRI